MKFPKKLFVRLGGTDSGSKEDEYWWADEDCINLADDSQGLVDVAVYELASTGKLATRTQFIEDAQRKAAKRKTR
jgi:hypothetical protein